MHFSEIKDLINEFYPEVLDEPGEVFFGSKNSLARSNGVAIIGLNPGGSGLSTVNENLSRYENNLNDLNFSGYLDQCWHEPFFSRYESCPKCLAALSASGMVHQDRHQKMVSTLAHSIGINLRETIAMNAIWIQTRTAVELQQYLAKTKHKNMLSLFTDKVFPIFKEIFSRCETKFVICLGNGSADSSFELFRSASNTPRNAIVCVSNNYRDGKYFETHINGTRILFFGVAHPSLHITSSLGIETMQHKWHEISQLKIGK